MNDTNKETNAAYEEPKKKVVARHAKSEKCKNPK